MSGMNQKALRTALDMNDKICSLSEQNQNLKDQLTALQSAKEAAEKKARSHEDELNELRTLKQNAEQKARELEALASELLTAYMECKLLTDRAVGEVGLKPIEYFTNKKAQLTKHIEGGKDVK